MLHTLLQCILRCNRVSHIRTTCSGHATIPIQINDIHDSRCTIAVYTQVQYRVRVCMVYSNIDMVAWLPFICGWTYGWMEGQTKISWVTPAMHMCFVIDIVNFSLATAKVTWEMDGIIMTPCACARGKAISCLCHLSVAITKINHQISTSSHLSNL